MPCKAILHVTSPRLAPAKAGISRAHRRSRSPRSSMRRSGPACGARKDVRRASRWRFCRRRRAKHAVMFAAPAAAAARGALESGARGRASRDPPWRVAQRRRVLRVGHHSRSAGVLPRGRSGHLGTDRRQTPLRAVRQVRERRGPRRRSNQDRRRAGRRGGPRLPRRGDLARGRQGSRQRIGIDDGAGAAGGVDAAARARRGVVDRAVGYRRVARIDRDADAVCGRTAAYGAGRPVVRAHRRPG